MAELLRAVDVSAAVKYLNLFALLAFAGCAVLEGFVRLNPQSGRLAAATGAAQKREKWLVAALVLAAAALRLFRLGSYPMGLHNDEASLAYDALCLAEYGTDRYGYAMPSYLVAWGGGQNVLLLYLVAGLYKLFGYSVFLARLPQVVMGTLAVLAVYLLLRKLSGRFAAGLGAGLFAFSPWLIMAGRWALDVYPLVLFLTAGLAFFLYADERPALYIPALACFALCLYCYVTSVLFLAPFLVLLVLYWAWHKKINWKWFGIGVGAAFLMALPMLLFFMVNMGWIPEIRTAWLSVPRLPEWRGGEVGGFWNNAPAVVDVLVWQKPYFADNFYDSMEGFGIIYLFSAPFAAGGAFAVCRRAWHALRKREFCAETVWVLWLGAALFAACMVLPFTLYRCIPLGLIYIVCTAYGLRAAMRRLVSIRFAAIAAYGLGLCLFLTGYFFYYAPLNGQRFNDSLPEAYAFADSVAGEREILVPQNVGTYQSGSTYPYICLNRQLSPDEFQAQFNTAPNPAYVIDQQLANYMLLGEEFGGVAPYGTGKVYVLQNNYDPVQAYEDAGFTVQRFRNFSVAFWP